MTTTVCVGAIVRHDDRILLVRQAHGHSLAGQWALPWGLLEDGESPAEAALRETREESGVSARIEGLAGVQELPSPWQGWIALLYLCSYRSGAPTPDGFETDGAGFFSLEDLAGHDEPIQGFCHWVAHRALRDELKLIRQSSTNPFPSHRGFL